MKTLTVAGFDLQGREDWKFADPAPLVGGRFPTCPDGARPAGKLPLLPGCNGTRRLVIWNGMVLPDSTEDPGDPPSGVVLAPLAEARATPEFGSLARTEAGPLAALNREHMQDALLIELGQDATPDHPLELIFVTDSQAATRLVAPRVLIITAADSRAVVIERHLDLGHGEVLNVPVTEIFCAPGAELTHLKLVNGGDKAMHYGSTFVRQDAGSRYTSGEFLLGGARIRRELHVRLAGAEAACDLSGLSLADGLRHTDVRTRVHHDVPGCATDELYKGIFADRGQGVFDGLIRVAPGAQQTRAFQTNRNLLLGDDAVSYSIPRLEIYADDVKCSHGSTTGQLGREEMFYLRSRGFDAALARRMLSYAFASEVLERVPVAELREELTTEIHRILDGVQA